MIIMNFKTKLISLSTHILIFSCTMYDKYGVRDMTDIYFLFTLF